jgi:hypothetical protein
MSDDPDTSDAVDPVRGSGFRNAPTTRDVRLLAMALREHWPMAAEPRAAAIRRLEDVVSNPDTKPRAFRAAVQSLASLSRLNLCLVETAIRAREHEELERRLTELEGKVPPDERT